MVPRSAKFDVYTDRDFSGDARAATFHGALAQREAELIIPAGAALIESLPDNDPLKARVMVETAREIVRKEKESANALPYIMKVAQGEVAATRADLIESRFMLADAWHYYWFAPLKAYRSYKEILAAHGEDEGVKARCLVEMAACMLELARMPDKEWRADMEDARRACKRVMAEVPAEFERAHAVADLMYCETFLYEVPPRYQESLDAFAGFEERHPGRTRGQLLAEEPDCFVRFREQWFAMRAVMDGFLESHRDRLAPAESTTWRYRPSP